MVRLIKRYESRKLYDTEESRYVSLEEIGSFVRDGQEIKVIDNATEEDVTAHTLTQIILEVGRSGRTQIPIEFLHDMVRMGEKAWSTGVDQMQQGVDKFLEASMDKLAPIRRARDEMTTLRSRLEELEGSLRRLEQSPDRAAAPAKKTSARKAPAKRVPVKKAPAKKAAKKTVQKKSARTSAPKKA
jgi:polyhydroxyalkanoate synthesis repressor PhaR